MRFFKREPQADPTAPIDAFWQWWAMDRDQIAAAIADGSVQRWVQPISERVRAIDPRLAWELCQGQGGSTRSRGTPEGDPAVARQARLLAGPTVGRTHRRWLRRSDRGPLPTTARMRRSAP